MQSYPKDEEIIDAFLSPSASPDMQLLELEVPNSVEIYRQHGVFMGSERKISLGSRRFGSEKMLPSISTYNPQQGFMDDEESFKEPLFALPSPSYLNAHGQNMQHNMPFPSPPISMPRGSVDLGQGYFPPSLAPPFMIDSASHYHNLEAAMMSRNGSRDTNGSTDMSSHDYSQGYHSNAYSPSISSVSSRSPSLYAADKDEEDSEDDYCEPYTSSSVASSPVRGEKRGSSAHGSTRKSAIPPETMSSLIQTDPDNKFTCLYADCNKRFNRKYNIQSHIQTHLSDRPFKCQVCHAGFVRRHDLRRHARIHGGEKPHKCPCGKGFARMDAMTRHRQRGICVGKLPGIEIKKPRGRTA